MLNETAKAQRHGEKIDKKSQCLGIWYVIIFEIANWKLQIENFIFPICIFQLRTLEDRLETRKKGEIKNLRVSVFPWFKNATCTSPVISKIVKK